jgi:hypothetical protein
VGFGFRRFFTVSIFCSPLLWVGVESRTRLLKIRQKVTGDNGRRKKSRLGWVGHKGY